MKPVRSSKDEITKFWEFSGYKSEDEKIIRRYGEGEMCGKVLNYIGNRFLKNESQFEKDETASTREALFVSYDKDTLSEERDNQIAARLPKGKDSRFRAKKIKYGNYNAMWEILSSHIYLLTGLKAPENRMMICEKYSEENGEPKIPDIYVASPLIKGYCDLGDFLINEKIIASFIKAEDLEEWKKQAALITIINNRAVEQKEITAKDKAERVQAFTKIYAMMPEYFHREIEKAFIASKFIDNWDFANFNLNNIGVTFLFDRDGNVTKLDSAFVDFGNSGKIGFKGKAKENSFERANTEAKPQPNEEEKKNLRIIDYDPAITFTEEENVLITHKLSEIKERADNDNPESTDNPTINDAVLMIFAELADHEEGTKTFTQEDLNLRRSIVQKSTHHILRSEAKFSSDVKDMATVGYLSFSDLPRNLPFYQLFAKRTTEKTKKISDVFSSWIEEVSTIDEGSKTKFSEAIAKSSIYCDSKLEMAFRFSLIADYAIEKTVKNWYLYEQFPTVFTPKELGENDKIESAQGVAEIFKARRDVLVKSIPREAVNEWIARNPFKAIAAEREVGLANLKENYEVDFDDFETRYPYTPDKIEGLQTDKNRPIASPKNSSFKFKYDNSFQVNSHEQDQLVNPENSISARKLETEILSDSTTVSNANLIVSEITKFREETDKKCVQECEEETEALRGCLNIMASNPSENLDENQKSKAVQGYNLIQNQIAEKEREYAAKALCEVLKFIDDKIPDWKVKLGIEADNGFFDIDQIQSKFYSENRDNLEINSSQMLSQSVNSKRNSSIHLRNEFTYKELIRDLENLFKSHSLENVSPSVPNANVLNPSLKKSQSLPNLAL